jgi:hypothetical protein
MGVWERVWKTALNLLAMAFGSTEPVFNPEPADEAPDDEDDE